MKLHAAPIFACLIVSAALVAGCGGGSSSVIPSKGPDQLISPPPPSFAPPTAPSGTDPGPSANPNLAAWTQFGYDQARTGNNPSEKTLGPGTVSGLTLNYSMSLASVPGLPNGVILAQPLVETFGNTTMLYVLAELPYVASNDSRMYAIDMNTAQGVWYRDFPGVQACGSNYYSEAGDTPLVDPVLRRVYLTDGSGKVQALSASSGATVPGWPLQLPVTPQLSAFYSALAYNPQNGLLYVPEGMNGGKCTESSASNLKGFVAAVKVQSAALENVFNTVSTPGYAGGDIWSMGGASIDASDGSLYVATGNSWQLTPPNPEPNEAIDYAEHVVKLAWYAGAAVGSNDPYLPGPPPGDDADFGSTPVLFQFSGCQKQIAVKNKYGQLFVYNTSDLAQGLGPVQTIQFGGSGEGNFIEEVGFDAADQMLFVTSNKDGSPGAYAHGITAFRSQGCKLSFAWQNTDGAPQGYDDVPFTDPTTANGVVYFGASNQIFANDVHTGALLWNATLSQVMVVPPTVVQGHVFAVDMTGTLYDFTLPGTIPAQMRKYAGMRRTFQVRPRYGGGVPVLRL